MRSPSCRPAWKFVPISARLALLAFLIICASVSQDYSGTVRAQTRHVDANVVAWQTLKPAQHVLTSYSGRAETISKLQSGAVPLAMASADFDSDGVADLVIGYAHSGGGILALHRGNLDAFAPQSHASWLAIAHELFPSPFLPQAMVIDLPQAPQFVVTGDFNGKGRIDILTGARGSERLYLLMGKGKGKFSAPQAITLPGKLTALTAGEVGVRDGKTDVVAGIQTASAAAVLVYKGSAGGLAHAVPVAYAMPQAATQLEIADLHGDGFSDVAVRAGGDVLIIHPTAPAGADTTALIERVPIGGVARSIAVGGFVWERHSRNQLAVLSNSGIVHILSHGELDTRPFTAEERFMRRSATLRAKLPSELKTPWSGQSDPWNVVKSSSVSAPLTGNVRLMAVSMAHARPQDLMVVDSSDSRLHVLPANTSGDSANEAGELTVETGDAPVAVLPVRVNTDARPGLVMVGRSVSHPKTMAPRPDPTFYVNRLDDPAASTLLATVAATCNNISTSDTSSSCSLRQAVIKANTTPGSDTVMLPAGTFTLQQIGLAENMAVTGDVDVRDDLSIVGSIDISGNPTSIIQGCGGTSGVVCSIGTAWNDKFISTNKDGTTSGSLSISNVIFQNGNNTNTGTATFDYLGGALDFFGCGTQGGGCTNGVINLPESSLSITNVQFLNNTAAGCLAGNDCGGGADAEFGPTTVSSSLFSGNAASLGRGGALTLVGAVETMSVTSSTFNGTNNSAQEGGALYIDFQNTSGTGSISIHSSTFSNNTAGADGGGIYLNLGGGGNTTTATIDQLTVISGNSSATRGGGLVFSGITGTIATPGTTSLNISKVTITGNQANGSSDDGGGAILVASGGTLTLQFSRIVGNTTMASGKPTGITLEAGTGGSASTVNAADNWWGCNPGPSATPCDTVATVNGVNPTATVAPWIVLTLAANPTSVQAVAPNNTSSLTADFLHDSVSGAVSLSNIDVLLGLPITFGATAGSISGAQATIQPNNGMAIATFTHDANCNASSATATVDTNPPPTVTTPITILCPDLIAGKSNSLGVSSVTTPLASANWTWTIDVLNGPSGTSAATFTSGQTIFTDKLPGGSVSYSSPSFNPVPNMGCSLVANVLTCSASGGDVTLGVAQGFFVGVTATATAAGSYVNPTGGACAVDPNNDVIEFNESNNSCSNTVIVVAPPTISKAFGATSIPVGGTTTLTFTLTNPSANTVAESGVAFSDTLTGGLQVAATPNLSNSCGGTFSGATSGSTSLSLSGGAIPVNSSCTISLNVTGTLNGVVSNTTDVISSTNGGTGVTSNTAMLTVANPPSISKAFGAASIPLNGTTSVTFKIINPNSGLGLTGVAFTDNLPAGLVVATPNVASNTCNGILSDLAGSSTISLSGGTLASSGSCAISVNVTGTTAGIKQNTTGAVSSTETGPGATSNTATLTVVAPPAISKAFNPTSVALNANSTLSFTITNPNTVSALSGVAFTDNLPAGVVVAATPNVIGSCGSGTITAVAGSGTVSLSGGTLTASPAAGSSCTFSADVTATTVGTKSNTTGAVTSTEGGTGSVSNTAILSVLAPPSIAKVFNPSTIAHNATASLTFTITNPPTNGNTLTGVAFTDTLPTGLTVANASATVCGGTLTTTAPTGIALSGASINSNSQCQFSVTVTGSASGQYTNTTGNVTSTNGGTGNTATANLTVATPPTIIKSFGAASVQLNGSTSLSFTITNPAANSGSLTGIAFTDSLPAGVVVATPSGLNNGCGGTATAVAGSSSVSLSGATLTSNTSCAISVNVTGTSAGVKNNSVTVTSTETGQGNTSNASITVVARPAISKAFAASSIPLNTSVNVTFTITNPNTNTSLTGLAFSDSLPSGLPVSSTPSVSNTCSGTITAAANSGTISLSGGSVAAGISCAVTVSVTGTTAGTKNNTTGTISSTEGGTGSTSNTAMVTVVAPPTISKTFAASTIHVNTSTNLRFTVGNPAGNSATLTGVAFIDHLPSGLAVSNPSVVTGSCGGGTITATASSSSISLSGATLAVGASCSFSVSVTGTANGTQVNNTNPVTSTNGGTGNSATASVTVTSAPVITAQPANQTVCAGTKVTFTAAAAGPPAPTVQWQTSFDGGANWYNIPQATSTTLTFRTISPLNGSRYRAVFTNLFGSATTTAATLSVDTQIVVTQQPKDQNALQGQQVTFTTADGSLQPTLQWQVSTNLGTTWSNIPGATSTRLTFTATAAQEGNRYRAVFTNSCGQVPTQAAVLDVE
jgi:fimbrial isopeptide formation D2 family protein